MTERTFTGYRNPVLCALAYLKAIDMPADETSFARVAALRGDASAEEIANGFVVVTYDDLQRLCEMAEIVICAVDGVVHCFTPEEWLDGKAIDV